MIHFVCVERVAYWVCWISLTIYALYQFALACQTKRHHDSLNSEDFNQGKLNDNYYDASDFEWQSFKRIYINYWYIVFIHLGLSTVFTVYNQPLLKLTAWILITLYATNTVFSTSALIVVLINVLILILLAILGKNILSYTLCFGVVLASQSTEIADRIFNRNDPRMTSDFDYEEKRFLFTYCICFLNARGLSSSLDNLTIRQKKEISSGRDNFFEKVITIAAYLLYLPGFFAGPIYLFNDFENAVRIVRAEPRKRNFLGSNYFKSMGSLLLLILNAIYFEWLLHWLYSSAVSNSMQKTVLANYTDLQLTGFVVSLFLIFYLKYCCIIGTFRVLATFDGIEAVSPPIPQCPASMHLTSQLWRKFDVGLYQWLLKYIYIPIAGNSKSIISKLFATLAVYISVLVWHLPLTPTLILWITLNIFNSLIEIWARAIGESRAWKVFKSSLSEPMYLRVLAFISLPIFFTAIVSNVFFLSEKEQIGLDILNRIIENRQNFSILFFLTLYCGANVSLDYNRVVDSSKNLSPHGFPSCPRNRVKKD